MTNFCLTIKSSTSNQSNLGLTRVYLRSICIAIDPIVRNKHNAHRMTVYDPPYSFSLVCRFSSFFQSSHFSLLSCPLDSFILVIYVSLHRACGGITYTIKYIFRR